MTFACAGTLAELDPTLWKLLLTGTVIFVILGILLTTDRPLNYLPMSLFWLTAAAIFLLLTWAIAKGSLSFCKKQSNEAMWRIGGMRFNYWQGVVIVSRGITVLDRLGEGWCGWAWA